LLQLLHLLQLLPHKRQLLQRVLQGSVLLLCSLQLLLQTFEQPFALLALRRCRNDLKKCIHSLFSIHLLYYYL
jgi:hypothetical protein